MRCAAVFIITGIIISIVSVNASAGADTAGRITVTGNTVNVGIRELLDAAPSPSVKDLESLAVGITDRYHELGYTTSYVEKIVTGKDGKIEIRIRESRIMAVEVAGISDPAASLLKRHLVPLEGELYNSLVMRDRAKNARRSLGLAGLKIYTENFEGGSDVLLRVEAKGAPAGRFSGGMIYEPIYGLSPVIDWNLTASRVAMEFRCESGYRDGEMRKLAGEMRIFALINPAWSLYAEYAVWKKRETWESKGHDYNDASHNPGVGARYSADGFFVDLSFVTGFISLDGYEDEQDDARDAHIDIVANYSDRRRVMNSNDDSGATLSMSAGTSSLNDDHFLRGEFTAHTIWSPLIWMKFRLRCLAGHTTARERYYLNYVFDRNLPGFKNDFTAARSRYVAGMDMEFEAYPETLYLGPVVNTGYFLDETGAWNTKTGVGASMRARLGSFSFLSQYAWELTGNFLDGGALITAEGTF